MDKYTVIIPTLWKSNRIGKLLFSLIECEFVDEIILIDNAGKFFEHFEYDEFNDASINAKVRLNKKTTLLEFSFEISGSVNVNCDLTNEPFNQEIKNQFNLVVNFGEEYNEDDCNGMCDNHRFPKKKFVSTSKPLMMPVAPSFTIHQS